MAGEKFYKSIFVLLFMKKIFIFIVLTLFITSFIFAQANINQIQAANDSNAQNANAIQVQARILTQAQIQEIKKETKRIRVQTQENECPDNCTCTDSVTKCELENGREMTIRAGKSGNIIVQVKGINMSTNVTLYKSEGKVYGVFKNNNTKEIRVMPDMVKNKIREKIARELEDEEIKLDEDGIYQYRARKKVKLFGFIRTRIRVSAEINSETGELVKIRNSWWGFLASDDTEPIIGAGCGTVSPTSRDECCMNKGYHLWNEETVECVFSE